MPERLPEINLLPEYRQDSNVLSVLFYLVIILIFLALIFMGYFYFSTKGKLETLEIQRQTLTEDRDILMEKIGNQETGEDDMFKQAVVFAEHYAMPTSTLILKLNDLLPDYSYLTNYNYNYSEVSITTHFETLNTIAEYTTELLYLPYIRDTKVNSIRTFNLEQEEEDSFQVIPRYETIYSLTIYKERLKEESKKNE